MIVSRGVLTAGGARAQSHVSSLAVFGSMDMTARKTNLLRFRAKACRCARVCAVRVPGSCLVCICMREEIVCDCVSVCPCLSVCDGGRKTHASRSVLVVTDVAARGVDIPLLDNVINYDFPDRPKLFVHRVGRVARAGRDGVAWSLVDTRELPYMVDLFL